MENYTRHHYIPQFILREFCESDNKMYISNHINFTLSKEFTKNVFMAENLYDYDKDEDIKQIEKDFNKYVEMPVSKITNRLRDKIRDMNSKEIENLFFTINRKELHILKKFFLTTKFRTEANMTMYLDQNVNGGEMSEYNINTGEDKIDFWKRELRYILDTEWDNILKEHKMFSVSMNAYETSKNFFGILYTPYEFVISDMGLVSERNFVPPQFVDKEGLGKVFELFEKMFDAKISKKDTFSKDIKIPFLDNYVILPISPNIAIISISPFWKEEVLPKFLLKMPFIRTGLKREYLLPPRNVYINQDKINRIKKNEVPNFEDIFSEEDQFIYKINVVSKDETILLNTLMMNESMKYVGFKSPLRVIDSFSRYAKREMEDYCVTNKKRNYDGFPALLRKEINTGTR